MNASGIAMGAPAEATEATVTAITAADVTCAVVVTVASSSGVS